MINIVHGGGDAWNAILFPMQNQNNQQYFYNQVNNFSNMLTDVGSRFMSEAKAAYERINSSEAMAIARAAIRAAGGVFQNQITPLRDLEQLQQATPLMQRWVMAFPDIRNLYHAQQCSGYAESYVDMHPGDVGTKHYDYRRVMDGVVIDSDEGSVAVHYVEDLLQGDRDLTHHEKVDILNAWDLMSLILDSKSDDPTCPYGSKL